MSALPDHTTAWASCSLDPDGSRSSPDGDKWAEHRRIIKCDMLKWLLLGTIIVIWTAFTAGLAVQIDPQPLKVDEVQGARARGGRQLQQTFGSSSIVPMVIDDSPCVSFNADDSSPILDPSGTIVGYTTVHSNGYDAAGLSVLRLDIVTINVDGAFYYFATNATTNGTTAAGNVRASLGTGLPNACPTTRPSSRLYGTGLAVDCKKRRASLDVSVPTALFNCTVGTTEDFNIVFFLQIELDLAPAQCSPSPEPFYAGSIYNAMPAGSGCTYAMVTAACKPSTCTVDRSSLSKQELLTAALGSTGRIDGRSQLLAAPAPGGGTAGAFGVSGVTIALIGGVVGGVITAAAVAVVYVLIKRGGGRGAAARARRARRSRGAAAEYDDRPEESSFAIHTIAGGGAAADGLRASNGRDARRAAGGAAGGGSRLSISGRLTRISEIHLPSSGGGRWRDKFGGGGGGGSTPVGGGGNQLVPGGAAFPVTSGIAIPGITGGSVTAAAGGPGGRRGGGGGRRISTILSSAARLPSVFFSSSTGTFWAQPNFVPSDAMPDMAPIRPQLSIAAPHRGDGDAGGSTLVGATAAVPMVVGRAVGGGMAGAGAAEADELAPPENASSVFLNPLALLRGGGGAASRLGTASARAASRLGSVSMSSFTGGNRPSGLAAGERPSRPTSALAAGEGPPAEAVATGLEAGWRAKEGGWRRAAVAVATLGGQSTERSSQTETAEERWPRPASADADPTAPLISRRAGIPSSSSSSGGAAGAGPIAEGLLAARAAAGLTLGGDTAGPRPWALAPLPLGPTSAMAAMATAAEQEEDDRAAPSALAQTSASLVPSSSGGTSSSGGGGGGGGVSARPVPLVLPPPFRLPPLGLGATAPSPSPTAALAAAAATPSRLSRFQGPDGSHGQAGIPTDPASESPVSTRPGQSARRGE